MHSTHFWYKFNLHWRKIVFIFSFFIAQNQLFSQTKVYNRRFLENYDQKDLHFGFYFGSGFTRFDVTHNDKFQSDPNVENITSPTNFAFKVGLVVNKFINKRWDIRTTPGINITNRALNFDLIDRTVIKDNRDLDFFELPVLLKFKSDRRKNSRMYLVAGGNMIVETNVTKSAKAQRKNLPTKTTDFCIEYGVGLDQFLEFGKLSAELRFSSGLRNLFEADPINKPQSIGIDKLKSHTVTFSLFFE